MQFVETEIAPNGRIETNFYAKCTDRVDIAIELGPRQAILGNTHTHHPTGDGHGIKDGYLVAAPGEVVGGGETRRTGTDNGYSLIILDFRRSNLARRWFAMISREAFQIPNGDRGIELAAAAGILARSCTDPATDARKRIWLCGYL